MAIKTYSDEPYHDDFSTDKNFLRILFRPGRSVQVRELNQIQSNVQDQIDKFGRHVFKDGDRVLDGYTNYDEGIKSVPILFINNNISTSELNALKGKEVVKNGSTNLRAKIVGVETTSIGSNNYRLYLKYAGEATGGGDKEFADGDQIDLASGEDSVSIGGTSVAAGAEIGDVTSQESTGDYGGFFQDEGVFFVKGHFVHTDATETFQIKGASGKLSGDVFFDVTESIVTSSTDSSLLDNANGQPNINAPGADRYKIALSLKFVLSADTTVVEGQQRVHLLEVVEDKVTLPVRTQYGEIGKFIAQRTEEESGSYTLKPFQHDVREYLNDEAGNRGKYTDDDILNSPGTPLIAGVENTDEAVAEGKKRYVVGVEPSTAYVQGYRVELENKEDITFEKGRESADEEDKTGYKIGASRGMFIEGSFMEDNTSSIDQAEMAQFVFKPHKTYTLVQDRDNASTVIGTCRIHSIEETGIQTVSAVTPNAAQATKRLYIYDLNLTSGKKIGDAEGLVIDNTSADGEGDAMFYNSDGFTLNEIGDDKARMVYPLSDKTIKTVSEAKYVVQKRFQSNPSAQSVTLSAGTGKFTSIDPKDYVVIQEGTDVGNAAGETFAKSVRLNADATYATVELFQASGADIATGAAATVIVFAPVEITSTSPRTKTSITITGQTHTTTIAPGTLIDLGAGGNNKNGTDVYELTSVTHSKNPDDASEDIKGEFKLITGQTDTHYGKSQILYVGNKVLESGTLTVDYKHWQHGGTATGYFTANSYQSTDLEDIPKYDGLRLSNCIDFRPNIFDNTEGQGIRPNTVVTTAFTYYKPRRDIVVLTQLGDIKAIEGVAADNPIAPTTPKDSILLLEIDKPGYVFSLNDLEISNTDYKRYTMRDIGTLENRIQNLEYYTALTSLENEAANKQLQDSGGNRFKNGILTDGFTGHGVGDVTNPDYRVAIDRENQAARPLYLSENSRWSYVSGLQAFQTVPSSLDWNGVDEGDVTIKSGKRGNALVLDFIEKTLIDQPYASGHISVNPYDVATWSGTLELSPSSDEWKDVNHVPDIIQNVEGDNSALLQQIANQPNVLGTEWNEWSVNWGGRRSRRSRRLTQRRTRLAGSGRTRIDTFQSESIQGIQTSLAENFQREIIDDKLLSTTFIPFIRSRKVFFRGRLLKPNTKFYLHMDDVNITSYATDNAAFQQFGGGIASVGNTDVERFDGQTSISGADGALVTNGAGEVSGWVVIPNNDTLRFRTGSRQIRLTDSSVNNRTLELSAAETTYHAKGLLETRQRTILSTRELVLERTRVSQTRETLISSRVVRRDPVAQTFMIGNEPTGIFLSSVDIFFQAKDPNLPIELSIVTVENGIPTQNTVPFSKVIEDSSDISIDGTNANAQAAHNFEFDTPVYLEPGIEYAIVLISNSARYRVWFAEPGQLNKVASGNAERITKNVNLGVLLKSQNASTWTPDQNKDLKFKLKRADFKTDAQSAILTGLCPERGEVSYIDLDSPGSGYVTGAPTVTIADPVTGTTATAKAYVGLSGKIDTIEVVTNGSGYDSPGGTMPIVTIADPGKVNIPTGNVNTTDNTIELPEGTIEVENGTPFDYDNGGGASIGGLTSGTTYYVEAVEKNTNIRRVDHSRLVRLYSDSALTTLMTLTDTGNDAQFLQGATAKRPSATAQTDTWKGSTFLPIVQDMILPETSANYEIALGSGPSNEYRVFPGDLLYTPTRYVHDKRSSSSASSGDDILKLTTTLSTTNSKVSPVIDLDRASLVSFDNLVTDSSEFETLQDGGESAARYISKKIILNNPADQVDVYVDVMRPDDSTDIEVYAKYGIDGGNSFDSLGWTRVNVVGDASNKLPVSTDFEFTEVHFQGTSDDEFTEAAIKVLFKSSNKVYAPEIKNLRIITTI